MGRPAVTASGWAYVALGVLVWLALAVIVAPIVGRAIRGRDRQVPRDKDDQ